MTPPPRRGCCSHRRRSRSSTRRFTRSGARAARRDGVPSIADWWHRAAELGLGEHAGPGGSLGGGSVSGDGVEDLALIAEQIGKTVAPGPLHPVNIVLAGLVDAEDGRADAATDRIAGRGWDGRHPGRSTSPAVTVGYTTAAAVTATPTATGLRIDGVKDRVKPEPKVECCWSSRNAKGAFASSSYPRMPTGYQRTTTSLDLVERYARVSFDGVQVGHRRAMQSSATDGRADRTAEPDHARCCSAPKSSASSTRCSLDRSVGVRPALVRPTAGVLPGAQAPKSYADMKIWLEACRATTRAAVATVSVRADDADMAVSVAKSYVAEHAPGHGQQCVSVPWRYRRDVEHRPASVSAASHVYRSMFGTPDDTTSGCTHLDRGAGVSVMTETTTAGPRRRSRCGVRIARAQDLAGREHAEHRPGQPARRRSRRGGSLAACPRTPEEALGRRVRRHLLPARVRGPGPADRLSAGLRHRIAQLRDADHPQHADLHDLRSDHPRRGHRGAEAHPHRGGAARRAGAGAAVVGAQRRLGSRRRDHPRRPPRRQVDRQRREDLEHQRVRRRLRVAAGATTGTCPSTRA